MRMIICLVVVVIPLGVSMPSRAQMIWRQQFGPHRVLLYKEIQRDFYYCTWAIEFDSPSFSAFDFAADRPLTFRIRWRTETTTGVTDGLILHAIIDGVDFPFLISKVNRERVLTDITGEFGRAVSNRSLQDLWSKLSAAQSFRVYLPNGQFKDAEPIQFGRAAQAVGRCLDEAADMNKASASR